MPTLAAIDAALRDPNRFVPGIRRLGGGSLAVAAEGGLWRVAGRTAAVYALKRPTGRILALRIPFADDAAVDHRAADRWRSLATDPTLANLRGPAGALPQELRYMPDALTLEAAGFRSAGHPLVAMEFVPGGSLRQAAERATAAGDRPALAGLARATTALLLAMERAAFDHGRLGAGSILLRDNGSPVLVGLADAAWTGAPRTVGAAIATRDRLPALVLLTELLALAEDPGRAPRERPRSGRLLLSDDDLRDPGDSALLDGLRRSTDPLLATAAALLVEALLRGVVPAFSEAVAVIEHGAEPPTAPVPNAPTMLPRKNRPVGDATAHPTNEASPPSIAGPGWRTGSEPAVRPLQAPAPPVADTRSAADPVRDRHLASARLAASFGNAGGLMAAWETGDLDHYGPAGELRDVVARARDGESVLSSLRAALASGDAERIASAWEIARNVPGAALLASRVEDALSRTHDARVRLAVRRGDPGSMAAAVRAAQDAGVALQAESRGTARRAAIAAAELERVAAAAAQGDPVAVRAAAWSGLLDELDRSEAGPARMRDREHQRPLLEAAIAADDDRRILAAWDSALFGDDPLLDPAHAARVSLAEARLGWISAVRAAVRGRNRDRLRGLLTSAPAGAIDRLGPGERRRIVRLAEAQVVDRVVLPDGTGRGV